MNLPPQPRSNGGNADLYVALEDGLYAADAYLSSANGWQDVDWTAAGYGGGDGGGGGGGGEGKPVAYLPWDLPARWKAGGLVPPHVFTQFPVSQSNSLPSYEDRYWMKPGAVEQSTDHRVYGGWIRDAWPTRSPRAGSDWRQQDVAQEIDYMVAARIDSAVIDLLSTSTTSNHRVTYDAWFDQNERKGNPLVLALMPDGTAGPCNTSTNPTTGGQQLADFLTPYVRRAAWWKDQQGRYVVPIFGPEKSSNGLSYTQRGDYWRAFRARLAANLGVAGTQVFLWACCVDTWTTVAANTSMQSAMDGWGRWGDRDPNSSNSSSNVNRGAAAYCRATYGKPWMHWAAPGDTRPRDGSTAYRVWESRGSENFEATWLAAIDGNAESVQLVTWSDLSEHAHIMPSRNHGWVWLDLNTWFMHRYREGAFPAITRDGLYLFHRVHPAGQTNVTGSGGVKQTKFATLAGNTPWVDQAEVLCFLTAPATVEWLVDGKVTATKDVAAGKQRISFPYPATSPTATPVRFAVRAKRGGTVVPGTTASSPHPYGGPQLADDYHYRAVSSLRDYVGQVA